jgi:hypothetical protein
MEITAAILKCSFLRYAFRFHHSDPITAGAGGSTPGTVRRRAEYDCCAVSDREPSKYIIRVWNQQEKNISLISGPVNNFAIPDDQK